MFVSEMIDQLRDLTTDPGDTVVPAATKVRYLNRGQAAMFPKIYQVVQDATLTIVTSDNTYDIPAAVGTYAKLLSVEIEATPAAGDYGRAINYDVIPNATTPKLTLNYLPPSTLSGSHIRITAAKPLTPFVSTTYAAAGSELYSGPPATEELPILYAMMLISSRVIADRNDYARMSVLLTNGAASGQDLMVTAQFWRDQFNQLLEQLTMPLPVTGI